MKRFVFSLIVCVLVCTQTHAEDSIAISGAVEKPGDWTAMRIKSELAADVTTISYTGHDGRTHTSTAVPLLAVLRSSGLQTKLKSAPKADPKTKHFELRLAVAVQGSDGYVSAFSLAELEADVGNRHVWIAMDADGRPLAGSEGPLKLISPDDQKPARWVHAVRSISVIDLAQSATQPVR